MLPMHHSEIANPRVHDLLQLHSDSLHPACIGAPAWVSQTLASYPWLVVRRAQAPAGQIAVGVRGPTRSERWGCFIRKDAIRKLVRPSQLLAFVQSSVLGPRTLPFATLQQLIERWRDLALPWGPTGSVGFELATGYPVTTSSSDLDIAIRADARMSVEQARSLWERALELQTTADIRVESPECGFSLEEYAHAPSSILLRYPDRVQFGDDPWVKALESMEGTG